LKQHLYFLLNWIQRAIALFACDVFDRHLSLLVWKSGGASMAKAKKAAAKGAAKKTTAKKAAKKASPANTAGCCTIIYDSQPSDQVEGVTRDECVRLGRSRGGVGQWNKGSCA
jgi:hypothetical protein